MRNNWSTYCLTGTEPVDSSDLARARDTLAKSTDQGFGLTDAISMAVTERPEVHVIALDRRRFGIFRDRRGDPLTLLP